MFAVSAPVATSKRELYQELQAVAAALFAGETDGLSNSANLSALLYQTLPTVNWVGLYLLRGEELVLGPFQGKVACVRIALGRGVCGAAAARRQTIVVPDVNEFPGHIACDGASRSEIVVPLSRGSELLGVLDLDSPVVGRFDEEDAQGLRVLVEQLLASSDFSRLV